MMRRLSPLVAVGGIVIFAGAAGCSSSTLPFSWEDAESSDASSSANLDSAGTTAASDSLAAASSSGSGSSSGSNASGSSGGANSSGSVDAAPEQSPANADATIAHDAGSVPDAAPNVDSSSASSDAGGCADQAAWLTPMNQARAAVGDPPLVCDPIAIQVALHYASQCNGAFIHNANRNTDYAALGGTGGLGENIAAGAPTETIAAAVMSWVNEIQSYNHSTNSCASGQQCGHYTQIVWKTTKAVGCAKVHCTTPIGALGGASSWDFSVCDYSPPGNLVLNGVPQPPY